jgi:hypothetical protein
MVPVHRPHHPTRAPPAPGNRRVLGKVRRPRSGRVQAVRRRAVARTGENYRDMFPLLSTPFPINREVVPGPVRDHPDLRGHQPDPAPPHQEWEGAGIRPDHESDASRLKPCPASWWESRHVGWEHVGPDLEVYRSGPTTVRRPGFPSSRGGAHRRQIGLETTVIVWTLFGHITAPTNAI